MLFNSFIFWAFFASVLLLYQFLAHKGQNRLLLVASYVFYGYWDWRFLFLILLSTVVDFVVAGKLGAAESGKRRKALVALSVSVNLGILALFKYYGFFAAELNAALMMVGLNNYLPVLSIVLPVGISFYTFQTISYSVDVYRGHTTPAKDFFNFALYVSFFPQLVAGPIERSHRLLPQVERSRVVTREHWKEGTYEIIFGLFKKIVIADNMAVIVNHVFSQPIETLSGGEVLIGVYAFAFQIYGDFSGYSSIARGLAKLLGFDLMWNFRMPYLSTSPSEFWTRWHISLSSWLRDYLYIPLGGNRSGPRRTARNLTITMLLGGLWHGAAWTYIVWGAFHGLLLVVYRLIPILGGESGGSDKRVVSQLAINVLRAVLMFHLVCIGWLFFRADSVLQALDMLGAIAGAWAMTDYTAYAGGLLLFFVLPMFVYEIWLERKQDQLAILSSGRLSQSILFTYLLAMIVIFVPSDPQVFIYFQF